MNRLAELSFAHEGHVAVARIEGEVDISNAGELGEAIVEAVPNQALGLVVDLTDVIYLNSAGIRLLFDLSRRVGRRQQELRVVVPGDSPVRETLRLSGVEHALVLADELGSAVAELQQGSSPGRQQEGA